MNIQQIIPATGWFAANRVPGTSEIELWPLACFALDEEDGFKVVVGIVALDEFEFAAAFTTFVGYVGPGETAEKYGGAAEQANR